MVCLGECSDDESCRGINRTISRETGALHGFR